jgi:hypothetical protein
MNNLVVVFGLVAAVIVTFMVPVFADENLCTSQPSRFTPLELRYAFNGTGIIEGICYALADKSILVIVNGTEDSSITINIPKNIRCFLGLYNNPYGEIEPFVIVDGREVNFIKSTKENNSQDIIVNIEKNGRNEIEIIGSGIMLPTSSCLSPKMQQKTFGTVEQVICGSMTLMEKVSNGSAACVKSSTATKLSERGWGIVITRIS